MIFKGKDVVVQLKEDLKKEVAQLAFKPTLAIIKYDDPASEAYLRGRLKIAEEINVNIKVYYINPNENEDKIIELIKSLNNDSNIQGIMVDRPLSKNVNESKVLNHITSQKDVDGVTNISLGKLLSNQKCHQACTAKAALLLAKLYNVNFESKNVLVIGRSLTVGKPLALMLVNENATVTIAHSKTKDLKQKCQNADIIFVAIGRANYLSEEYINNNSIVIDIGINFDEQGKMVGDFSRACYELVQSYSPVPGGVGVLTNVVLMHNLIEASKKEND